MKRVAVFLLLIAVVAGAFGAGLWYARRSAVAAKTAPKKPLYWVDPMHPAYKSDKPGIAPDCGMNLEPVYEDGAVPAGGTTAGTPPAGTINVSTEKQQLAGVKYAVATLSAGVETIRATGRIAQDETRVTRVHPRIEGWISKTHVDFMGQLVKKGDPLLTLYSPEMLATAQEYLLALRARDTMKAGPSHDAYENSELMILAARRRLELWDLSVAQIDEMERTRKPFQTVTIYSPASGFVNSRNAFPSQRVTPETELYAIADLSHIWIMAEVFEADLPKIQVGQIAAISLPGQPGRNFSAKVTNIQPQVDPATRTLKVRLESENPSLAFKPEMFVTVEFRIALQNRVTIPADALIDTGERQTVFVDRGDGNLEQRDVRPGERLNEQVQIISGLRAGERVVSSGAFLIDSEAKLKAGAK